VINCAFCALVFYCYVGVRLEESMNLVLEKFEFLDHHMEHEFAGISDHIESVTSKLKKREDSSDIRIENLEDEIKKVSAALRQDFNSSNLYIGNTRIDCFHNVPLFISLLWSGFSICM